MRIALIALIGLVGVPSCAGLVMWLVLAASDPPPLLHSVPFSTLIVDRNNTPLRLGLTTDEKYRLRTPLASIPPDAVRAVLLYEDRYFFRHPGVNPFALGRAALSMLAGGRRMGGSTLTMQVARLSAAFTPPGNPQTRTLSSTLSGKLAQIWLALRLDFHYSKTDILEAYFSLAPYGGNVEGLAAASRVYFAKPTERLTLAEHLALAIIPQNPVARSPLRGNNFHTARSRMHRLWNAAQAATEQTATASSPKAGAPLKENPLDESPLRVRDPGALPFEAPHVSASLLAPAQETAPLPLPVLPSVLRTTLDLPLQRLVETKLRQFAARGRAYGLHNAAALLLHWPSMEIRALVGSADFHNAAIAGQVDGTLARRSPGSTLKPFIYALALDQGLIHSRTLLVDAPRSFGGYDPENFDRQFRGPLPADEALRSSRNIPAIQLASRLSPDLYTFLRRAEVDLPRSPEHYGLSLVLGGAEVSLRELAALYAMLPNRGVWRAPRLLADAPHSAGRALLSPEAALLTLLMLEVPGHNINSGRQSLPLRYKTGTSNRFRDAWTAGLIGPYVLVVWVGNFDNSPNPLLIGGEVAAPLFEDTARALSLHQKLVDPLPELLPGLNLVQVPTCTDTGDLDTSLCPRTVDTWYIPGRSPTQSTGIYRTILVDTRTGLRACTVSAFTEEKVWEFWPSDLQNLFAQSGVVKPEPPEWSPECRERTSSLTGSPPDIASNLFSTGNAPNIYSPKEDVIYQRRMGDEQVSGRGIPLAAGVDADARTVFWFINERFVGKSAPGETLIWQAQTGMHVVRAVDDQGRASRRRLRVEMAQ